MRCFVDRKVGFEQAIQELCYLRPEINEGKLRIASCREAEKRNLTSLEEIKPSDIIREWYRDILWGESIPEMLV